MQHHLNDLENALIRDNWDITDRMDGNDLDVSGIWRIVRYGRYQELIFEGMGDLEVLPMAKSYGCHLKDRPAVSLHFSKKGRSWPEDLRKFVAMLGQE